MIYGVGVDIIEIGRIEKILENNGDTFLLRLLTKRELLLLNDRGARRAEYVAGRFSAKEACSKALGTGIGEKLSFQDIELFHDESGRPYAVLSQRSLNAIGLPRDTRIHLSISHCDSLATSYVIVETP
jgi:holo-[acyl-carrier protein] synthase